MILVRSMPNHSVVIEEPPNVSTMKKLFMEVLLEGINKTKKQLVVETWESINQMFGHSKHHKHNAAK